MRESPYARRASSAEHDTMVALYRSGLTLREIAAQTGWSRTTVRRALRNVGEPIRESRWLDFIGRPEDLLALYEECDRDMRTLATRLDTTIATLTSLFRRLGLKQRSRDEWHLVRSARIRRAANERGKIVAAVDRQVRDRCAFPECDARDLELHHLNGDRGDSRAENLIALCTAHHMIVEFFVGKAKVHTVYAPAGSPEEAAE